ncbi:hypothetical protein HFP57_01725 [Parasphingopyxis algicola]|uniref:hypothetical protein n=1 Tax=Parasphingopyxis algicola TaxID=2026624 RepID=UPI0015A1D38D|nr:hypothetical protein [Parasphingopyxis algicola]QLC23876.1 hypothetical protein HFP57_01725 [Parasphingopyxis algicola]
MVDRIAWVVLALVHLLPGIAFFMPSMISRLYGVEAGSSVFPLLHHRAALFAVVLIICIWAAAESDVRRLAAVATAVSMLSFLGIYWSAGQPVSLRTIALVDLIGLPFLLFAAWRAFFSG